jgi:hypothetical protein
MTSILSAVRRTIAYLDSPEGAAAWKKNQRVFGFPANANYVAAIISATGIRSYEAITKIYEALGPALNAKRCGRVA